jgi:hypothetical protein
MNRILSNLINPIALLLRLLLLVASAATAIGIMLAAVVTLVPALLIAHGRWHAMWRHDWEPENK